MQLPLVVADSGAAVAFGVAAAVTVAAVLTLQLLLRSPLINLLLILALLLKSIKLFTVTLQLASWVVVLAKLLVVAWLHYCNNILINIILLYKF